MNGQFSTSTKCPNCRDMVASSYTTAVLLALIKDGRGIQFRCEYCGYKWSASEIERKKIAAEIDRRAAVEKAE